MSTSRPIRRSPRSISACRSATATFNTSDLGYNPGGPGDIVVVRLYYQYPVYVNLLGFNLSNLNGGYNLLAATAVFKTNPNRHRHHPEEARHEQLIARRFSCYVSRASRDERRGVSALEFAILLPLMMTLYLGSVEISHGVATQPQGHA